MLDPLSTPEAAPWSFEALYRQYGPKLLRRLRARCDDNLEEAKDLSQKIWQIVWRRSQELTLSHPWGFIEKVMQDELNGQRRTASRQRQKLGALQPTQEWSDPPELQEPSPELWHCLERLLPLDQKIVLDFYGIRRPASKTKSRPGPPYLRVVSSRSFILEIEEETPPAPIPDDEQARALSESLEGPWSPRRVKVRRSRALAELERCLRDKGVTASAQISIPGEGGTRSRELSGGPGNSVSSTPSHAEENSDPWMDRHPPVLTLLLTAEDPTHSAQQHLHRCQTCQAALAAVETVEGSVKALARAQQERWRRANEEEAALLDVWTRLQQSITSDDGPEITAPEPNKAESPFVRPAQLGLSEGTKAPDEDRSSSPAVILPLRTVLPRATPAVEPGWRFSLGAGGLVGMAAAAILLLAVTLPRPGADPLGLGNPTGHVRGTGEGSLFAPRVSHQGKGPEASAAGPEVLHRPPGRDEHNPFEDGGGAFGTALEDEPAGGVESSAGETQGGPSVSASSDRLPSVGVLLTWADGHSSRLLPLRGSPGQRDAWEGEYPLGTTLRLTVSPPELEGAQRSEQPWLRATWSGTLDCTATDQEDHTRASDAASAVTRLVWHQHPTQGQAVLIPLPAGPGVGGRLECRIVQTEDGGVVQTLRLVLTPIAEDSSWGR